MHLHNFIIMIPCFDMSNDDLSVRYWCRDFGRHVYVTDLRVSTNSIWYRFDCNESITAIWEEYIWTRFYPTPAIVGRINDGDLKMKFHLGWEFLNLRPFPSLPVPLLMAFRSKLLCRVHITTNLHLDSASVVLSKLILRTMFVVCSSKLRQTGPFYSIPHLWNRCRCEII